MAAVSKETVQFYAEVALNELLSYSYEEPFPGYKSIASDLNYVDYQEIIYAPLFVTFNIISCDSSGAVSRNLRGCIGNFGNLELPKFVRKYAIIAATEDSRFPPITKEELENLESEGANLECSVTVLHSFEEITDDPFNWQIGIHGIRIKFAFRNTTYSSTFLPEVAAEQEWNQTRTFDSLIQKAGVNAKFSSKKITPLKIERYQGMKGSCSS